MVQLITLTTDDLSQIIKNSVSQVLAETGRPQPQTAEQPEFYTRKQTAEKLHISLGTLDTYTRLGILNAVKIGSRVLYSSTQLNDTLTEKISQIKNKMK